MLGRALALFVCGALCVGGCGVVYPETIGAGPYGAASYPYPYASYYDWFAYTPGQRGPYYHPYPNLDYYVEYRPIYPG